jgi:hypothetical protein
MSESNKTSATHAGLVTTTNEIGNTNDPNPGLAMTLAAIAYCTDPATALQQYAKGWSLAWQADTDINGNLAYIAYNGSSQYVVAIRGSLLNFSWQAFDNWFKQDLNVFEQTPWTYPGNNTTNPMISQGSSDGLNDLIALVETDSNTGNTTTMYEFLSSVVGPQISIGVVGHSLGGNLATVYAPWLLFQLGTNAPALFPVLTFAAPTAGNQAFADAYDASFPNSWRYYNEYDLIPMASNSIRSAENLYPGALAASGITVTYDNITVSLADAFGLIADAIDLSEFGYGSYYAQTNQSNGSIALNSSGMMALVPPDPLIEQWFEEASGQHAGSFYLQLLGYPAVECVRPAV